MPSFHSTCSTYLRPGHILQTFKKDALLSDEEVTVGFLQEAICGLDLKSFSHYNFSRITRDWIIFCT